MAPRGRGGQGDGAESLSRIFTATVRPRGTPLRNYTHKGRPYGCLGPNPAWGQGFRAAGSIARAGLKPAPTVCEGSTHVRIIQEGWRNCGIRADWWGRNGADVVKRWYVCGVGWVSAGEWMRARESDVFFGYGGSEWVGMWARGCVDRGVRWGVRGTLAEQYGERKAMAVGVQSRARGQADREGDGFGRTWQSATGSSKSSLCQLCLQWARLPAPAEVSQQLIPVPVGFAIGDAAPPLGSRFRGNDGLSRE